MSDKKNTSKRKAPKPARRAKYKDRLYNIALRVDGSMKNQIIDAAKKNDMMLSEYILYCVWEHMRSEKGIPTPGSSQFALADPMEHLRGYLEGKDVLMPCGKKECDMKITEFMDMEFCETCNVRIS
jgi:hypothetical protein